MHIFHNEKKHFKPYVEIPYTSNMQYASPLGLIWLDFAYWSLFIPGRIFGGSFKE